MLWVTNPGDLTAPADIALGGCALCSGDASSVGENVALGVGTLENKTNQSPITGYANVAIGNIALGYLTSGKGNNAIGAGSGLCISSGSGNMIMGGGLGYGSGCTGSTNILIGDTAGFEDSSSTSMVEIGHDAGEFVNSGTRTIFIGSDAGANAGSSLTDSSFIGTSSGRYSSGNDIAAIGPYSCDNITAADVVCIGNAAGQGSSSANGSRSVFIGSYSGQSISTGTQNVFIGFQSGFKSTGGQSNVGIGYQSLPNNNFGGANVSIGSNSCQNITNGTWNVCIGYNSSVPTASGNGQLSIANAIYGQSNYTATTGVSQGCIAFYSQSCTPGTVYSAVQIKVISGACTGGLGVGSVNVYSANGAPTCVAPNGSLYMRADGGSGSRMYVSAGGGTWNAVSGV